MVVVVVVVVAVVVEGFRMVVVVVVVASVYQSLASVLLAEDAGRRLPIVALHSHAEEQLHQRRQRIEGQRV